MVNSDWRKNNTVKIAFLAFLTLQIDDKLNIPRVMTFQVKIVQVSCGFEHTIFRTLSGDLFAMGNNNFGQLGLGSGVNFYLLLISV